MLCQVSGGPLYSDVMEAQVHYDLCDPTTDARVLHSVVLQYEGTLLLPCRLGYGPGLEQC